VAQIFDQRNKKNDPRPNPKVEITRAVLEPSLETVNVVQGGTYIPPDAGLFLSFINQVALPVSLAIKFRYLDVHPNPDGARLTGQKIKETTYLVNLTDATRIKTPIAVGALNDVYVLDANINVLVGGINRATTYCVLYMTRSAVSSTITPIVEILCAGYLANDKPLSLNEKEFAVSGKGHMRSLNVTAPGAGNNFTYTVETNTRVFIRSIRFLLTTSATVANRLIRIIIKDATGLTMAVHEIAGAQVASLANNYLFGINLNPRYVAVNGGDFEAPMITTELLQSSTVATSITNIQAADTLTNIEIDLEEWYDTTGTSGIGGGGGGGEKGST
jgi:hypothetical protein